MSSSKIFPASDNFVEARIIPGMKEQTDWQAANLIPSPKDSGPPAEFKQEVFGKPSDDSTQNAEQTQSIAPVPDEEIQSVEEIREEAFKEGIQAGLAQADNNLNEPLQALANALEDISGLRATLLKENAGDMLKLIMAIAEQVIHCEVSIKEDVILATLDGALDAAIESDEYHIKINPDDFTVVTEKKPELVASITGLKNITLETDQKIIRGGCLIESDLGQVDATIDGRLDEIRHHLANSLEKG